jgi:hypothetical protein
MLLDVPVRAVKQIPARWQAAVLQDQPQLTPDLAIAGLALLPAGIADRPDERVDVLDYLGHDDRHPGRRVFLKDLG